MATSVTLPALGESVSEGTVTRWLKAEGDDVQADEPLLEVSTDKVDTEIPAPASGTLLSIKVGEDETVAVGTELALIGDATEGGGPDGGSEDAGTTEQQAPEQQAQEQAPEQPQEQAPEQAPEPQQAAVPRDRPEQQPSSQPAEAEQQAAAPPDQGRTEPSGGGSGVSVTLPALGESVAEGTVTRWLKSEGDSVEADEPLLEVSTDKVDTEIPAPASGTLLSIKVGEDETVAVGTELAVIGAADQASADSSGSADQQQQAQPQQQEDQQQQDQQATRQPAQLVSAPAAAPQQSAPEQQQADEAATPEAADTAGTADSAPAPVPTVGQQDQQPPPEAPSDQPQQDDGSAYVTPLVRKLAAEHGVDLAALSGTGVGGRIRKQDVLEAARNRPDQPSTGPDGAAASPGSPAQPAATATERTAAPVPSPLRGRTEKMSRLRAVIAQRMVQSLQTSAQLTTVVEVDVTRIARLRARAKSDFETREGVRLSFLPFFALASLEALKAHPSVNASIDTEAQEITYHEAEHLGVAVDTERGLLVPVVKGAGDLNLAGLTRKIADLAERTRNNQITPDELAGGTFTLTNTGSRGALFDTPILNQPQVAILGTGAVVKRPVVVDDPNLGETIAIRSMAYLALTYDHRLVDGADAARFLATVKNRLEEGAFESEVGL